MSNTQYKRVIRNLSHALENIGNHFQYIEYRKKYNKNDGKDAVGISNGCECYAE